ncbi:type II toxin-antitoxin system RelE/ParE family toxin [Rhodospirillum centenum]|uniref:Proteic killer suppression protein, putative n=1 Tax=Rhodospirillum centenum (strain ATCC 51521 / SW) TaxID=414684 RepID=B6IV38_RHOCS|nr:proteic killer suppression protein, putative [Rhodospirillum centenum SW]
MIRSFRSRALALYWEQADGRKLPVQNHARVRRQLSALDAAGMPENLNLPGYGFHCLSGTPRRWSIWVSGNYRITFGWDGVDAVDVDIEDYH